MEKVKEIHIQQEYCKGCGYCIVLCPKEVLQKSLELTRKGFYPPLVKDLERCTGCRTCQDICPDFAIYIVEIKNSETEGGDRHGK